MFRKLITLLVVLLLAFGSAACTDPDGNDCTGEAATCSEVVENNPITPLTCSLNPGAPGCEK